MTVNYDAALEVMFRRNVTWHGRPLLDLRFFFPLTAALYRDFLVPFSAKAA
jgi:hypothetical protein